MIYYIFQIVNINIYKSVDSVNYAVKIMILNQNAINAYNSMFVKNANKGNNYVYKLLADIIIVKLDARALIVDSATVINDSDDIFFFYISIFLYFYISIFMYMNEASELR